MTLVLDKRIVFEVPGRPRPQGSKRAMVNPHTGKAVMREQSAGLPEWRGRVSHEAHRAMAGSPPITCPVGLSLTFVLARPKSHYRTGRFADMLRDGAPAWPATVPDLDKLVRGALDGCTGTLLADDKLVVRLAAAKAYGWPERLLVAVDTALDLGPALRDLARKCGG